jgi:hypothetical protein
VTPHDPPLRRQLKGPGQSGLGTAVPEASVAAVLDAENWHPRFWTLAGVGLFHLMFATILFTVASQPKPPPFIDAVDIVTVPDGVAQPPARGKEALPVDLSAKSPLPDQKTPEAQPDAVTAEPPALSQTVAPVETPPPPSPQLIAPQTSPDFANQPAKAKELSDPSATPSVSPITPLPRPADRATVAPMMEERPPPVMLKAKPIKPVLEPAQPERLSLSGAQLKLKGAQPLKPLAPITLADPAPEPRAVTPPAPADLPPPTQPLSILNAQNPLPKVQLPRIAAKDLRVPETQTASDLIPPAAGSATRPQPTGVTALGTQVPSGPSSGASISNGGSTRSAGGTSGQGASGIATSLPAAGPSPLGGSGPITGTLPRRPGGASVRQPFPRGDDQTILGKMDKTYDCSRLNRERDARCPSWDPIEGRNARGAARFEVALPKGVAPPRATKDINPLPVCPPGTPGNQFGLSCLPTREGPGIPKP